jgi:F-type H+-transporting ATPase subunit b
MEALTSGLQPADILRLLVTNIVAFLIFVWLLRKWAWGPLIAMLDERKAKIQGDFATAEGKVAEAEQLRGDFEAKLAEIKGLEREKLQEATRRGEELAARLEAEAKDKASNILGKGEAELEREVASARSELRAQVVTMAIGAAEMLIKDRLDEAKHRQLVEDYIQSLGDVRG